MGLIKGHTRSLDNGSDGIFSKVRSMGSKYGALGL